MGMLFVKIVTALKNLIGLFQKKISRKGLVINNTLSLNQTICSLNEQTETYKAIHLNSTFLF
jgi:hypothetical protein